MKVLRSIADARAFRAASAKASIGLVPTMGALHAGHASLIERAVRDDDLAVVSIFVNPIQFGPHEDFSAYPRDEPADIALCERLGAAMIFAPNVAEMYPEGDATRVQPGPIAARLEGAARPGHFSGVATVVTKLFEIVRPDVAYFGQKDFQQLRVIQTMTRDLRLGVRVVGCPIVREPDGLALSSRNAYLTPDDRRHALALSRGLFGARDDWARGERDPAKLCQRVRETASGPGVSLEYVAVSDPLTLDDLVRSAPRAVITLAAQVGKARLIDNVLLGMSIEDLP
ncbi:MAG: pantoate--beta-alanine ligase [Chloroflexi bacterium 13_1_40CM_68_21]|nr:MAG: pantoate--beta-alanine ligase [Chloroflexi bacterium 13_1_40CM_68_21]